MSAFYLEKLMIPNIELFGKIITPYMLLALTGVLVILFYTQRLGKRHGLDEIHILYMLLFSFIGVFVGGHLLYSITNLPLILYTFRNLHALDSFWAVIERFAMIFGGSVYYGGLIGAVSVCFIYLKRNRLPIGPYSDVAAPAIPLFHFFGRLGCFLSGCCYGIEWEYGLTYHYSLAESANGVPRFPVQLAEALLNLGLALFMYRCLKKEKLKNRLLALYFSVYPVYRFLLEYLRGDEYRGFLGPLSTSQIISLALLLIVGLYWIISARKSKGAHHD